jgi:hypothetical protein
MLLLLAPSAGHQNTHRITREKQRGREQCQAAARYRGGHHGWREDEMMIAIDARRSIITEQACD